MNLDFQFNSELQTIFRLLDYKARLVGGCVRDYILYHELVYDVDIATELTPDEVILALGNDFTIIPTGLKHGTVTIVGQSKYEITTLRVDEKTDGRHATVKFGKNWEHDSSRRDFTINALYLDINGTVYDYHNGLQDLDNRYVKFIGVPADRIHEDYLRILRFFRFAVRFGAYDEISLTACVELAHSLSKISHERITQEWLKIVDGKYFLQLFPKMQKIFSAIGLRYLELPNEKLSQLGKTAFFWQEKALLKFSNQQKRYVNNLLNLKMDDQIDAVILSQKYGSDFVNDKMLLQGKFFKIPDIPKFPLTGQDMLNLAIEGKNIGSMLEKLERIWISHFGKIDLDELLKIAKENATGNVNENASVIKVQSNKTSEERSQT